MKIVLDEKVTHKEFGPMMDEFVSFASDRLGLKSLPTIRYKDQGEYFASFGGYNPSTSEIVIQTKDRHPMDVLRTLAHELVHHKQRENGEITDDNVEESGKTGSKIENHANAKAGAMMRDFRNGREHLFDSGPLVEEFLAEAVGTRKRKSNLLANGPRYKAFFYVAGPGSGKDYVAKKTGHGLGLPEINSDHAFEYLLGREGLSKTMPPEETARRTPVRAKAKSLTKVRQSALLSAGRGVIINTTGADHEKIGRMKAELERRGYDTKLVFVNTSNEVSRQRNIDRGKAGGRTVPEATRQEYWDKAQEAKGVYQKMFGDHFHHIDNSMDMNTASDDEKAAKEGEFTALFKHIRGWASSMPENPIGRAAVEADIAKRRNRPKRVEEPTAPAVKPKRTAFSAVSPEVNAAAKGLGLKHWGAGYFGPRKKGPDGRPIITHRVNEKGVLSRVSPKKTPLLPQTVKEDLRQWFDPKHPEGGWKRINSKGEAIGPCAREKGEPKPKCMSNEKRAKLSKKKRAAAVAAKRKHDSNPERKGSPINVSNFGKGKLEEENKPTNPELWSRAKALAKQKFDVYPSAYANGWASKWYKSKGGGWKSVNEAFEDFLDEEYGAGFEGTKGLVTNYKRMTPGQYADDSLPGRTSEIHPLVPEEAQTKKTKKKMVRKGLAQEVYGSKTDTALNVIGIPPGAEGFGPMFSVSASPNMGFANSPYGTGFPSNFTPYYGLSESVVAWASKPETQARFINKYGPLAEQKLLETMRVLSEGHIDAHNTAMGTVPKQGAYVDEDSKDMAGKIKAATLAAGVLAGGYIGYKGEQAKNKRIENYTSRIEQMEKQGHPDTDKAKEALRLYKLPNVGRNKGSDERFYRNNLEKYLKEDTPAWQRKEGKDPEGGLNKKGVASYRRANPGSKLQTAVTTEPSKLKPGSKKAKRRLSFCRRMKGMKSKLTSAKTARDPDSRINKSLRKWNCEE